MLYLLLRILFTVSFSHLLRFSQARTRRPLVAAAVNYLAAAVGCAVWAWLERSPWHPAAAGLGAVAGFTYVTSLVLMLPAMRESGVSVTGAVVQLSLMAPVGVAVWRFGELPNRYQLLGIGLTLVALPVLSASSAVAAEADQPAPRRRFSPVSALLFLSTGSSQVVMKEFTGTRPGSELPLYSAVLFAAATLFTVLWLLLSRDTGRAREEPDPETRTVSEWGLGTLMGGINVLQLVFLLLALQQLPAVVVFPLSASLGLAANTLASMLFWRERPPPAGWLGLGLTLVAVLLLNVRA